MNKKYPGRRTFHKNMTLGAAAITLACNKALPQENLNIKNRKISEILLVDKNLNEAGDYKLSCL